MSKIKFEKNIFDPKKVPDPTLRENLFKRMGRGMLYMRSYADSIKYGDGGRKVTLIKRREQQEDEKNNKEESVL